MPVTLAQAAQNTTDAVDLSIINELRTSTLMDALIFDDAVNPAGGGATLSYSYRRQVTMSDAHFRALNSEYRPTEATTSRHTVDLKPLGGSFQVDRVLANLGPAATNEVAFQMTDKINAAKATFSDAVINGDSAVNVDSFDGLSKALTGSSTEITTAYNWSGTMDQTKGFAVLEALDSVLSVMDGEPTMILTNKLVIGRIRAAARMTSMYVREPGPASTYVERYGGALLVDAGKKAGSGEDVIPVTGGTADLYAVRVALDGFHGVSTAGRPLIQKWLPNFESAGAVKTGEVEIGPVAVALKKTKAAAVARDIRIAAA